MPKTNKKVQVFVSFAEIVEIEENGEKKHQFGILKENITTDDEV
ncbi:MAG: hypothetical protein U5N85_07120 [Arcicella sp.]|nr:hypothetical protein [Arcicella sp.]